MALWGGRFEKGVDQFTQEFGASLEVDKSMAAHDIAGSRAHARMLAEQGIISAEDQAAIDAGLADIAKQIEEGTFVWDVNDEDVHHRALPQRPGCHRHPPAGQGPLRGAHGRQRRAAPRPR